jgi:hypothetical protein
MPTAVGIFNLNKTTAPVACSFDKCGNFKLIDTKVIQECEAECFGDVARIRSYSWSC